MPDAVPRIETGVGERQLGIGIEVVHDALGQLRVVGQLLGEPLSDVPMRQRLGLLLHPLRHRLLHLLPLGVRLVLLLSLLPPPGLYKTTIYNFMEWDLFRYPAILFWLFPNI